VKLKKGVIGDCVLYNGLMEDTIGAIGHFDHILTDPPYLYLKQDFDRPWDEKLLFESAKAKLPDRGFVALFGRGTSFYRWNTMLAELGFKFKEEIIWDKAAISSPCHRVHRVHETLSIHTMKNGKINKCKVNYVEARQFDIGRIVNDIRRIESSCNNKDGLRELKEYLITGKYNWKNEVGGRGITHGSGIKVASDVGCRTLGAILTGLCERSIIKIFHVHYKSVHPTQKPVRLAERLLALISDPGDTIYDPFMGSGSFGVACINTGRKYIGSEMKPEYFEIACKRIKEAYKQPALAEVNNGQD
jgi:site-specific DNA-methyltransferase (adenine-specific)